MENPSHETNQTQKPLMPLRVAIQGVKASFHDLAARSFFAQREFVTLPCSSFSLLCKTLKEGQADVAVMAIENSIAGSILPNYSLLETNQFKILGEIYLRIEHSLMALPGQSLEDIKVIQSHPMAILQCEDFLLKHPGMTILEGSDTAKSAQEIQEKNLLGRAAIANELAAQTYNLNLLKKGIESNKQNYTRFLIICRSESYLPVAFSNKASLRFEVSHKPGSLVDILDIFRKASLNLTKLQSVVILGRPYEYSFHLDLEWQDRGIFEETLAIVKQNTNNFILFGIYPRGARPTL